VLDAKRGYNFEVDFFSANWPKMASKVVETCRKGSYRRNRSVAALLNHLDDDSDDTEIQTVALFLLPYMMPPTIVKASSGKTKASKIEVQEEFIQLYQVSTLHHTRLHI
jgi:hypothetical protein